MIDLTGLDRELAKVCEITLFSSVVRKADVAGLVHEAGLAGCHGIALPSSQLAAASELIQGDLKLTCLVGFPFGLCDSDVKRFETEVAVDLGAHEIEVSINVGMLKDGGHQAILRELRDIAEAADERPVKVTIEPRQLTSEEFETACQIVLDSGAQMLNLQQAGIPPEAVLAACQFTGGKFPVKASGFRNFGSAAGLLQAGAVRLGYLELGSLWNAQTA